MNPDPQKKYLDNIINPGSVKLPDISSTTNKKLKTNKSESQNIVGINKKNLVPLDDTEFRKTFKKEKIELDCETPLSRSKLIDNKDDADYEDNIYPSNSNHFNNSNTNQINNKNEEIFLSSLNLDKDLISEYPETYNFLHSINILNYFNIFIHNEFIDMQSIILIEDIHLDDMNIEDSARKMILYKIKEVKGTNTTEDIINYQNGYKNNKKLNSEIGTENNNNLNNEEIYNEEEQRRLFQEAVLQFRNGGSSTIQSDKSPHKSKIEIEKEFLKKEKQHEEFNKELINTNNRTDIIDKLDQINNIGSNKGPYSSSATEDQMSIPVGLKTYCWICYKAINIKNCVQDDVIFGKVSNLSLIILSNF